MGWNHHLDWIFTISTGDRWISEPSILSRGASSKVTLGERWANFNFEGSWLNCPKLFKRQREMWELFFTPNPWGRWIQFDEHIFQMGWWKKPPTSHFLCQFFFGSREGWTYQGTKKLGGCWECQKGGVSSERWPQRWPSIENLHCRNGLGGGNSNTFFLFAPLLGEDSHFEYYLSSFGETTN